jgi:hypothetical protein
MDIQENATNNDIDNNEINSNYRDYKIRNYRMRRIHEYKQLRERVENDVIQESGYPLRNRIRNKLHKART